MVLRYESGVATRRRHPLLGSGGNPGALFVNGEKGALFDPSNMPALFQDSAGTTPVTAVEQPVGKMLDLSGNGNHATQATAGNRPTLRARYNLLTYSEQYDNAIWTKTAATVTANSVVAPDGNTTADTLTATGATAVATQVFQSVSGTTYTHTVYAKAGNRTTFDFGGVDQGVVSYIGRFDLNAGTVAVIQGAPTVAITPVGNGWYRCSVTRLHTVGNANDIVQIYPGNNAACTNGDYIYLWGSDLRWGSSTTYPYQRIADAATYDTAGFKPYLAFNGTSSSMATGAIDFSATHQVTTFAGINKPSDPAGQASIAEFSTPVVGGFLLYENINTFNTYSNGGSAVTATSAANAAPFTAVLTAIGDTVAPTSKIRVNGTEVSLATAQGGGNYSNAPFYIGARGGAASFWTGNLYALIVRGAASSAAEIAATESWVNRKTGAY